MNDGPPLIRCLCSMRMKRRQVCEIHLITSGVEYTPYYLVNAIEVRGGTLVRLYLSTRPEVDRVIPSPRLRPAGSQEQSLPQSIGEFRTAQVCSGT